MSIINFEIMLPFMKQATLIIAKELLQVVHEILLLLSMFLYKKTGLIH